MTTRAKSKSRKSSKEKGSKEKKEGKTKEKKSKDSKPKAPVMVTAKELARQEQAKKKKKRGEEEEWDEAQLNAAIAKKEKNGISVNVQHRQVWVTEWNKLNEQEEQLKNDIVDKLRYLASQGEADDDGAGLCLEDWIDFDLECRKFHEASVGRLDYYRKTLKERYEEEGASGVLKRDFANANKDYRKVLEDMENEATKLDEEVKTGFNIPMLTNVRFTFAKNVEEEFVATFKSSESKLKRTLMNELRQIDQEYEKKLKDLDRMHKTGEEPANWTSYQYDIVQHVLEQYSKNLSNRRALMMDVLRKRFAPRSVLDVSSYMSWCQNQFFHRNKVNSTVQEWERARIQWLRNAIKAMKNEEIEQAIAAKPQLKGKMGANARGQPLPPVKKAPIGAGKPKPPDTTAKKKKAKKKDDDDDDFGFGFSRRMSDPPPERSRSKGPKASTGMRHGQSMNVLAGEQLDRRGDMERVRFRGEMDRDTKRSTSKGGLSGATSRSTLDNVYKDTSFSSLMRDANKTLKKHGKHGPKIYLDPLILPYRNTNYLHHQNHINHQHRHQRSNDKCPLGRYHSSPERSLGALLIHPDSGEFEVGLKNQHQRSKSLENEWVDNNITREIKLCLYHTETTLQRSSLAPMERTTVLMRNPNSVSS